MSRNKFSVKSVINHRRKMETHRRKMEAEAQRIAEKLAQNYSDAIPLHLRLWANDIGLIRPEENSNKRWLLPSWLTHMITRKYQYEEFSRRELSRYGFSNFDDLERKFKDLETAWGGKVRTEVEKGNARRVMRVTVFFYPTELVPPEDNPGNVIRMPRKK